MKNNPKKQMIVKAAQKRFVRHGLAKTTVEEIARDLRMGKATVYHYFESKEEIFYEVLKGENERYLETVSNIFANPDSTLDIKLQEYTKFKGNLSEQFPLLRELLFLIINEKAIEKETEILRMLIEKEEALLAGFLNDTARKKQDSSYARQFVLQSYGFLFSSVMIKILFGAEAEPSVYPVDSSVIKVQ